MYTHVCIATAPINPRQPHIPVIIKKGDYCTLVRTMEHPRLHSKVGMVFKEHEGVAYDAEIFLPIPPQQEKTVYVAVSEQLVESVPEIVMN